MIKLCRFDINVLLNGKISFISTRNVVTHYTDSPFSSSIVKFDGNFGNRLFLYVLIIAFETSQMVHLFR
jgi:hypothetical protein